MSFSSPLAAAHRSALGACAAALFPLCMLATSSASAADVSRSRS